MTHSNHPMHANSLAAYDHLPISKREAQVLAALESLGGIATDRAIAEVMGSGDPNVARPRVTGLIKRGILREVGTDLANGRKQRLVEMNPDTDPRSVTTVTGGCDGGKY